MFLYHKAATGGNADRKEKLTPIWQTGRSSIHSRTEDSQVPVQLPVIERTQFHLYRRRSPFDPSWKPKERREPLPRRVGIGGRKVAVADPHDEICQRKLAYGHDLIFAVIELVHGPFIGREVFQFSRASSRCSLQ